MSVLESLIVTSPMIFSSAGLQGRGEFYAFGLRRHPDGIARQRGKERQEESGDPLRRPRRETWRTGEDRLQLERDRHLFTHEIWQRNYLRRSGAGMCRSGDRPRGHQTKRYRHFRLADWVK